MKVHGQPVIINYPHANQLNTAYFEEAPLSTREDLQELVLNSFASLMNIQSVLVSTAKHTQWFMMIQATDFSTSLQNGLKSWLILLRLTPIRRIAGLHL